MARKLPPNKIPVPTSPLAVEPSPQKGKPGRKSRDRDALSATHLDHGGKNVRIHYEVPSVAKYCARVIVAYAMDYTAATRAILSTKDPDVSNETIHVVAGNMEASKHIQDALEVELTVHGLDDTSKQAFVKEMWDWLRGPNEEYAKKAAQILGRGFIAEKAGDAKPEMLPIAGLDAAVSSMLQPSSAPEEELPEVPHAATTQRSADEGTESPRGTRRFLQRPSDPDKHRSDA